MPAAGAGAGIALRLELGGAGRAAQLAPQLLDLEDQAREGRVLAQPLDAEAERVRLDPEISPLRSPILVTRPPPFRSDAAWARSRIA